MDFVYKFPVVKGCQAGKDYYIAMVPLKMINRLFPADDEYVLPEFRAQRKLNESRIPVISKYIIDNRENYVFSALAASIDGEYQFKAIDNNSDIGILEVSMDAHFLINDGQHRKAAITEALKEDSSLGEETISVVFFEDKGLERSQQIFTDLNKHAVKTSNSISELYDSRDLLAIATRNVISNVAFLEEYTDKEKDNLGKFSSKLFTLNTFYRANKRILKKSSCEKKEEAFLLTFWQLVADNILPWKELENKEISKIDLRENYIVTQGIVIQALGVIGRSLINESEENIKNALYKLRDINWKRSEVSWKQRAIRNDGKILANETAIILTANIIKKHLGISLTEDELEKEKKNL